MSQPKLTLRPPPNVDFVQGYPGIPPGGADRPQAAVKGAIEVRVGQQGVKAKWVRIELRKVETLPGGGAANTFFDFVGQSPIHLWQSPNEGEYSMLHTNDFPFFIRIPESIPPTIALEKGGIKYELIASVCVQGKKGFLRRDKPIITATASPIIIDKHELHSTWPIYSQPETRSHSQDGVTLIVQRDHTCYGPGDRVVVNATVKSDTLHTVMLRGFEFMLRETTIFRAAPHTQGKKGSPQVKVSSIGEQKVPVNVTLYGGTQHKAELSVTVPPHHTSATINAARHIDINYVLTVKALMNTGQPIIMDLPVMISNWPKPVSLEAMRRIGHAFNVSLPPGHPSNAQAAQSPPAQQQGFAPSLMGKPGPGSSVTSPSGTSHSYSNSIDKKPSVTDFRSPTKPAQGPFNTAPSNAAAGDSRGVNEFGERKKSLDIGGPSYVQTIGAAGYGAPSATSGSSAQRSRAGSSSSHDNHGAPMARPRSSGGRTNPAQRLTIVNASEDEIREQMEAEKERARRHPSTILESPISTTPPPQQTQPTKPVAKAGFLTAEQEKVLLYQNAVAKVERTQAQNRTGGSQNGHGDPVTSPAPVTPPAATGSKPQTRWLTAEEEKARLFEDAQRRVARARGFEGSDASGSSPYAANVSSPNPVGGSSSAGGSSAAARVPSISAGAALYSEAMSAINKPVTSPTPNKSPTTPGSALPSAADEKAMLQRYYEAKNAVWQTQSSHYGRVPGNAGPVQYDSLYQATSPATSIPGPQSPSHVASPHADMPPPFADATAGSSSHPILSEKERQRRHYEAMDAAAAQQQQSWQPAPPLAEYASSPPPGPYPGPPAVPAGAPPPFSPSPKSPPLSAYEEKEMLRRRYEQQDSASAPGTTPTPPPRASQVPNGVRARPPPTPPISPNAPGTPVSARPLTAAEEKARLKALYEAEDRAGGPPRALAPPAQSPYPSPPPSNGYHDQLDVSRTTPSPQTTPPPPPPLAPKPPREYIEETQLEDKRTTAKLQAIDAAGLASDPDLASVASSSSGGEDIAELEARDSTFGPGALSTIAAAASRPGSAGVSASASPGPSRQGSYSASGALAVPRPPPLPPKVQIE
ncbi:hypothetical protein L226DRAFT_566938 [Lentinus tigrinus ALCF2SS1-7]|uniref:Arrestin C-terminal-like domain-containing protein n=1 Tax=Lentinus tigrinus ALCF2SS1-6 TaxID=1328759 RepID=A0A5C2T204_9APHY|nr:hypothetical protein L227DRAFT_606602 [Lentinus tigrinus ALCF2SS1-6]RPD80446.1 hypothetical protein L226DRAFT_566938 [Lentinus tigrinus ALCF2SS1-7]